MKTKFCLFFAATSLHWSGIGQAVEFHPQNASQLQSNLNTAAKNGFDDVIVLRPNTVYRTADNDGGKPFLYSSVENHSLSIRGAGMGSSVIDGGGEGGTRVLNISTSGLVADVEISGITLSNGEDLSGYEAAGLNVWSTDASFLLKDSEILSNRGGLVGGVYLLVQGKVELTGNVFSQNRGELRGAAHVLNPRDFILKTNHFSQNQGEIASLAVSNQGVVRVEQNVFVDNRGDLMNADFMAQQGDTYFTGNLLVGNEVTAEGGINAGLRISASDQAVVLENNILFDNRVTHALNDNAFGAAVAVFSNHRIDVVNNTIFGNGMSGGKPGARGGGLGVMGGDGDTSLNFYNNVIFGNFAGTTQGKDVFVTFFGEAQMRLHHNDFHEICFESFNDDQFLGCDSAAVLGAEASQGNLDVDPRFVDVANGDLRLASDSPVIDQGSPDAPNIPSVDFSGQARVVNGRVDIGALESVAEEVFAAGEGARDPVDEAFPSDASAEGGCALSQGPKGSGRVGLAFLPVAVAAMLGCRSVKRKVLGR